MIDWNIIEQKRNTINKLNLLIVLIFIFTPLIRVIKHSIQDKLDSNNNIEYYVRVKSGLNLRIQPNGKIIENINYKEKISIIDSNINADWVKVNYKDRIGYVKRKYLEEKN